MLEQSAEFQVRENYDYSKSSEENYKAEKEGAPIFVGKYQHQRRELDYNYHSYYTTERQLLQDMLIDRFNQTVVHDQKNNVVCETPLENWIVFTAGPMGAGKGHTMQWLYKNNLFPLEAFVNVDPDNIRALLPETPIYNRLNKSCTGILTQREVGYVTELLTIQALEQGKNVLVDSSLRDADWFVQYFEFLRSKFPTLKIAILNVNANSASIFERARKRGLITGRVVPEHIILDAIGRVPHSMQVLSPKADFFAYIRNEDDMDPFVEFMERKSAHGSHTLWTMERVIAVNDEARAKYRYRSYDEGNRIVAEEEKIRWEDDFTDVWAMECALPLTLTMMSSPKKRSQSRASNTSLSHIQIDGELDEEEGDDSIMLSSDSFSAKLSSSILLANSLDNLLWYFGTTDAEVRSVEEVMVESISQRSSSNNIVGNCIDDEQTMISAVTTTFTGTMMSSLQDNESVISILPVSVGCSSVSGSDCGMCFDDDYRHFNGNTAHDLDQSRRYHPLDGDI